ncbi:hypothetical protein, partial [Acidianus sp. RZ1]|uniref:hypothetical protein n=1 Tax=Acidianus sp. RZ1 TaxID=1540082 RepID=UPI0014913D59
KKVKAKRKDIEPILDSMEKDGKLKAVKLGGGKAYKLNTPNFEVYSKEIKDLQDRVRKLEERFLSSDRVSTREFDDAYARIRDSLGYAPLEKIRLEVGLTKEEFYSKFRRHIEERYDLIAGGEEGYVRRGSLYGIIKRRDEK